MIDDDQTVGHLLSRRKVVALLGTTGAAWLTGALNADTPRAPAPNCVVRPQQTEGPYFVDERLNREDIRSRKPGRPLSLTLFVSRLRDGNCQPLPGAQVDLWQCDAMGVYSGVQDRQFDTTGESFLRGYQVADERGAVRFLTVYPGWYPGRTVHLHFKIRAQSSGRPAREFTSQLYFDDALTDLVHSEAPYAARRERRT
ncbi:MAG TPA: intradiol ring-cleavage dioxygenase, partial [Thermoanaerobaculia bacterium]|nr:intradiol ring-cleavage dioxygenase [Thermoanaerobaculia bacterium]